MRNFTQVVPILAAGMMLLGFAQAQQTPAAKTEQAPAAKAQPAAPAKPKAPAPKAGAAKTAAAKSAATTALKTPKDKFSYALGMNLGASLHKQSVDVDPNMVAQGLRAALAGGKTLLTQEEAQAALMEVQNELRKKQQEKMEVAGEANKKEGEAFPGGQQGERGHRHAAERSRVQDPERRQRSEAYRERFGGLQLPWNFDQRHGIRQLL